MPTEEPVFLVDDDESVRRSLRWLFERNGFSVRAYASAEEFLDAYEPGKPGCLVVDLKMPGMSGLELQAALRNRKSPLSVVVITGHGDIEAAVHAMKAGAVDFVSKPIDAERLLTQVRDALARATREHIREGDRADARNRITALTNREHEVMELLAKGLQNKEIATHLGISPRTVEVHRTRVMQKLGVSSIAELVRLTIQAESAN